MTQTLLADRYAALTDATTNKRYNSPFWLRRWAYRSSRFQLLEHMSPGQRVLDAGCGDGILACVAAARGMDVTAIDISAMSLWRAHRTAEGMGVNVDFQQGDAAAMPFDDESFDLVYSCHVLEHLDDINAGLRELHRVARSRVLIAMPTCLSPSVTVLLGKGQWWRVTKRTPVAPFVGAWRMLQALVRGEDGPNEWYEGHEGLTHIWRFPWVLRRQVERAGFRIVRWEAGPFVIPYLPEYVPPLRPLQQALYKLRAWPVLRYLGYGSLLVCEKR